ncbi:MAG TPA: VOC family protein [Solirubrobacteraceae bacterium]|nr:VOC family protein [Solirubrobacteraceae bacterium]
MLANRSAPPATVTPELVYDDVERAVEWLCHVFGLSIRWQAGDHRAQLRLGDGTVVVRDRPPDLDPGAAVPGGCSAVLVRVEDLDALHARVLGSKARVVRGPSDQPYGERQFTAEDLAGHRWTFTQSIADVAPEEWGGVSVDLS